MSSRAALVFLEKRSKEKEEKASQALGAALAMVQRLSLNKTQIEECLSGASTLEATAQQYQQEALWRARLHHLEASCDRAILQSLEEVELCRRMLVDAQVEALRFQTIIRRNDERQAKKLAKQEQKASDEFASMSWRRQQAA